MTSDKATTAPASNGESVASRSRRRGRPWLLALALGLLFAIGLPVAAVAASSDQVVSDADSTVYTAGETITVKGTINGDVFAAGQRVVVTGKVKGDVIAAAQEVVIEGTVTGSVRAAAQSIVISGDVERSVTLAGETVHISDTATVGQDATLAGSTVTIDGTLRRDAMVGAGDLTLGGTIGRDLVYAADHELSSNVQQNVGGDISYHAPQTTAEPSAGEQFSAWLLGLLYGLLALTAAAALVTFLAPRWVRSTAAVGVSRFGWSVLAGLIVLAATPIAIVLVALTYIGLPIAAGLLLLAILLGLLAHVVVAALIGRLILRRANTYVQILVGAPLLALALSVPVAGIVFWLATQLIGVGAIALWFWQWRRNRAHGAPERGNPSVPPTLPPYAGAQPPAQYSFQPVNSAGPVYVPGAPPTVPPAGSGVVPPASTPGPEQR